MTKMFCESRCSGQTKEVPVILSNYGITQINIRECTLILINHKPHSYLCADQAYRILGYSRIIVRPVLRLNFDQTKNFGKDLGGPGSWVLSTR